MRRADKQAGVARTQRQRNMAALSALVKRGFARPDGTYPAPLGNIVMSQAVAEWAINTLTGAIEPTDTVPVHPTDVDGRCELIDGTAIHPFLAVFALGLIGPSGSVNPATLRRYVMDADSRLLECPSTLAVSPNGCAPPPTSKAAARAAPTDATTRSTGTKSTTSNPSTTAAKPNSTTANPNAGPTTKPKAPPPTKHRGETDRTHHNTNPAAEANHPKTTPTPSNQPPTS